MSWSCIHHDCIHHDLIHVVILSTCHNECSLHPPALPHQPHHPTCQSTIAMLCLVTEVWRIVHFWVCYVQCIMPGSPMGWSEGLSRRWAGYVLSARNTKKNAPLLATGALMLVLQCLDHP